MGDLRVQWPIDSKKGMATSPTADNGVNEALQGFELNRKIEGVEAG